MKNSPMKNATRTTVFGDSIYSTSFQAGVAMWNIFDQLEMHMKHGNDHEPMKMLHELAGRFGNRASAILKSKYYV